MIKKTPPTMKARIKMVYENSIQIMFMLLGVAAITATYIAYAIFTILYSGYQMFFVED